MLLLWAAAREDHWYPFQKVVTQQGLAPEPDTGVSAQAAVLFHSVVKGSAEGKQWDVSRKEISTAIQLLLWDFGEDGASAGISVPYLHPYQSYAFKRPFYCHHRP